MAQRARKRSEAALAAIPSFMGDLTRDIIRPLAKAKEDVVPLLQLQEMGFELEVQNDSGGLKLPELDIDDGQCRWARYFIVRSSADVEQLMTREGPSRDENSRMKRHVDSPLGSDEDVFFPLELQFEARNLYKEILDYYMDTDRGSAVIKTNEYIWTTHDDTEFSVFSEHKTESNWFVYWTRICETAKWEPYYKARIDFVPDRPHMQGFIFQRMPLEPGKITAPELLALVALAGSRATLEFYKSVEVFPAVVISVSGRDFRILQGQFNFQKKEYRVCMSKTLDFNKGVSSSPYELSVLIQWALCVPIPVTAAEASEAMSGLSID